MQETTSKKLKAFVFKSIMSYFQYFVQEVASDFKRKCGLLLKVSYSTTNEKHNRFT